MPHRVLVVVGTRPEAIKMAPVVRALEAHAPALECGLALTGQHTTLVDQALEIFSLRPDYDLDLMTEGQSLYDVIHLGLDGLRDVVRDFGPEMLLVQGDTATVLCGALVAFLEKVQVGHVEAGLRSHDKWAPFPEEIFRRMTDVAADLCFAPTPLSADQLRAEGVDEASLFVTGNTVVDALISVAGAERPIENDVLRSVVGDPGARLVLLTAHRRESFGEPIREVFRAVRDIADRVEDVCVVYPVHPNPNVSGPATEELSGHPRIRLVEPLGYIDLVGAMRGASLVLTDSGGIQEEAPTFGAPVLVLREVTERPEGVEAGVAELVGTDRMRIVESALRWLEGAPTAPDDHAAEALRARPTNPYGDGRAGERIADIVASRLTGSRRETEDWRP